MATMTDDEIQEQRRKVRDGLMRLTRWKLRDMRRRWTRPRARRLQKEARALKSLLAEACAAGFVPPPAPAKRRGRACRPRAGLGEAPPSFPQSGDCTFNMAQGKVWN